ncbi:hypothetical protein FBU30_002318 [Linnemannia zychae]|nr:hypothetical protein FBU30_002318 [Linnemannia zychae]
MTDDLQALHHQQEQERQALEKDQHQEQEQLFQLQQRTFQEKEQIYICLQKEYHDDPTPQRAHEILMLEQEGKYSQELFAQQQQHLLERQQQDRLRMQERQWAQEHIAMQEIQTRKLLQQHHIEQHQHQHQHQQSQHHHQHHHHQHQFHYQQQHEQQHQQKQHQQPHPTQHINDTYSTEAMDVDDEVVLHSITSTISSLRQNIKSNHITGSIGAWAEGAATQRRSDDNDPDAAIILDTNVLISHLNFFQSLVKSYEAPTGVSQKRRESSNTSVSSEDVIFVIPWIVMQELDGLKGGGRNGSEVDVSGKARLAIEYLRTELNKSASTSRLRGQKMSELVTKTEANDDKILDCCQYFRILYPVPEKTRVILFTNDKNLSIKAVVHDIEVISRFDVQLELSLVRNAISRSNNSQNMTLTNDYDESMTMDDDTLQHAKSPATIQSGGSPRKSSKRLSVNGLKAAHNGFRAIHNDRELERIKSMDQGFVIPEGMDPSLYRLTNHIIKNLRRYLDAVIPDHLRARYGPKWRDLTRFDTNPVKEEEMKWDTKRLVRPIQILQEHWSAFSDPLERPSQARIARESMDRLQAFVKTWTRVQVFGLGKVYKKDVRILLDDVDLILAKVTILPDTVTNDSLQGTASFYDAKSRITLVKDWRAECDRLLD